MRERFLSGEYSEEKKLWREKRLKRERERENILGIKSRLLVEYSEVRTCKERSFGTFSSESSMSSERRKVDTVL